MFLPWMAPLSILGMAATFSGSPVALAGIFQTIQWVTSDIPFCGWASGSWKIKVKLAVPLGTFVQPSAGDTKMGFAAQKYSPGMSAPSLKPPLDNRNCGCGGAAGAAACCAAAG